MIIKINYGGISRFVERQVCIRWIINGLTHSSNFIKNNYLSDSSIKFNWSQQRLCWVRFEVSTPNIQLVSIEFESQLCVYGNDWLNGMQEFFNSIRWYFTGVLFTQNFYKCSSLNVFAISMNDPFHGMYRWSILLWNLETRAIKGSFAAKCHAPNYLVVYFKPAHQ